MKANAETQKIFGFPEKYMPHLSLLYGNFPQEIKEEIMAEVGDIGMSFVVKEIGLFSTEGEVKDWYRIKNFSLR